ncbi:minor tail protein [Mycobacterium phage Tonenili]|uniref:Uncharacterized protein n=1 Tax=Mycobacterium phage Tonenili TaxID=1891703 RepID=A0A1C9EHN4_9CAUD|nr:minor tail protein [Mycobacterium phage Tonenili]AON96988.1 hypothetical protein SEA_TONENILI_270 [Mycobacterium phage Tonenili]
MSTLKYVGRAPDADFSVTHKKYVTNRYDAVRVDAAYINGKVAEVGASLVTPAYVAAQDAQRATKAAVDAADANYLPVTARGAAGGVVPIDEDGYVPSDMLPTLQTERKAFFKNVDTVLLSGNRVVTTVNAKEFQVAEMTIPDPGFPYIPLIFATIQGAAASAATTPLRHMGTNNYGQLSVLDDENTKYAWAVCGSRKTYDFYTALPFADPTVNPTSRPPVYGPLTLGLWIGLWSGTTFTFNSTGLQFYAICYPGIV